MIWRVKEISTEDRKHRSLQGEQFARCLLAEYTGQPADSFMIARSEKGKPYLCDGPEFNLSHSGKWIACAVGDQPLGIDIEAMRPLNLKVAQRICTPKEMAYLSPEEPDAPVRFLKIWTAKEAYFKALGTGITGLQSVCYFDLLPRLNQVETEEYVLSIYQ